MKSQHKVRDDNQNYNPDDSTDWVTAPPSERGGLDELAATVIYANAQRSFTNPIGGIDPTLSTHLTTRGFVEGIVGITLDLFFNDTSSDIGGIYYNMTNADLGGAESTLSTAGLGAGDGQALVNFASLSNEPGIETLKSGIYDVHIHAEKTAGTKPVNIYAEIYTRTSGGAETLHMTTEVSGLITSEDEVTLHANLAENAVIDATDRIVVKFFANVGSTGSNATVALYQEGSTSSHVTFPTTTEILNMLFLRLDGLRPMTGTLQMAPAEGFLWDHTKTVKLTSSQGSQTNCVFQLVGTTTGTHDICVVDSTQTLTKKTFGDDVSIVGSGDAVQLTVKGYSTQNEPLQEWQKSDATVVASMSNAGRLTVEAGIDAQFVTSDVTLTQLFTGNFTHTSTSTTGLQGMNFTVIRQGVPVNNVIDTGMLLQATISSVIAAGKTATLFGANMLSTAGGLQNSATATITLYGGKFSTSPGAAAHTAGNFVQIGGWFPEPPSGNPKAVLTSHVRWSAVFGGNVLVEDDAKLYVEGSPTAPGDSYMTYDSGNAMWRFFVGNLEQMTLGVSSLTIPTIHGIDYAPGSDVDVDLITVNVGGTPILKWDESSDSFDLNKGLVLAGPVKLATETVATDTTLDDSHADVFVDATLAVVTVTLPAVSGNAGLEYTIKKIDGSANAVTIDGNGAETIDDSTTKVLSSQYDSATVVCDGTEWWIK